MSIRFLLDRVPKKYRFRLAELKNALWGGYRRTHYSQFGEDVALLPLVADIPQGVYVDVGAHHPKRYSNTYLLYKKGWRGINIDPNPMTIELFDRARPGDTNIVAGVAAHAGEMDYYMFSDPAVNTFVEAEARGWMEKRWLQFLGTKKVRVRPLRDILSELNVSAVDLLSIDAEGMDLEVLQSNDWNAIHPRVVVVEVAHFDASYPSAHPVFDFLVSHHGYKLRGVIGPSLIFSLQ